MKNSVYFSQWCECPCNNINSMSGVCILYDNWWPEVGLEYCLVNSTRNLYPIISTIFRAVVWTDTIQFVLMVGAIIAVIVVGILRLNHPSDIFSISNDGGRLILFEYVAEK